MISFTYINDEMMGGKHPIPIDYEDIIVLSNGEVVTLTKAKVAACVCALVKWEGGPFRVRMDGGQPISGVSGYLRSDGDEYFHSREEAIRLVIIIDTVVGGINGSLRVTYYG